MKIRNNKIGIVFWITGLSGSGKTTFGKRILKDVTKKFGPTILINGDDFRKIFKLSAYDKKSRFKIGQQYSNFCKFITKQNLNVIITVVGLFHKLHNYNRRIHKNYFEVYIKSDFKKIKERKDKPFYKTKTKNIWGVDIKPEFPLKPNLIINNNFNKDMNQLTKIFFSKIKCFKR